MSEEKAHQKYMKHAVPFFYRQGKISEKDYKKWLMDETGKFKPKLIY